jgi:hypothetical protein
MIVKHNSKNLLKTFITKYINCPTQITPKSLLENVKYNFALSDQYIFLNDINYAIILTYINDNERLGLVRFYQIYLFKVYGLKETFINTEREIDWFKLRAFIEQNKTFKSLFLSCFYYYF